MTNKLCKNCASWLRCIPMKYEIRDITHQGVCKHTAFVYSSDDCIAPIDGLVYWDADSYAAGFNTGENFGCIHFRRLGE